MGTQSYETRREKINLLKNCAISGLYFQDYRAMCGTKNIKFGYKITSFSELKSVLFCSKLPE